MATESDLLISAFTEFHSAVATKFPRLLPELREPRPAKLPYSHLAGSEQLASLWRLTSGQPDGRDGTLGIAGGLRLLGAEESEHERGSWISLMTQGDGFQATANPDWDSSTSRETDSVQAVYYAAGWIPLLAEPYEANYLAVDLVPLPGGQPGQIILCGRDEDRKCVVTHDLATLLLALARECQSGAWALKESTTPSGKATLHIERRDGRLLGSCKSGTFPGDAGFSTVRRLRRT